MSKFSKIFMIIVSVILILGIGCSCFFGIRAYQMSSQVYAQVNTEESDETTEDDVCIADEYYIRSTTAISDAYLSGDTSALDDRQKETLDMAKAVIDEVITDDMTDYEKEKAIYDWMCANLGEDESGILTVLDTGSSSDVDNPYGVLKYHNAVCVGYATTFRLFMQMMNIECKVVHNTELYHSWDLVKIDGHWYHTDIYADAGSGNYSHFNENDAMRAQEAEWDTSYFPAADSLECNMCYQNMYQVSSVNEIPAAIRKAMDEGNYIMCFKLGFTLDEDSQAQLTYMLNIFSSILDSMYLYEDNGEYYSLSGKGLIQDGEDNILYISIYHEGSDSDDTNTTARVDEDLLSALQDAFSDVEGIEDTISEYREGYGEYDGTEESEEGYYDEEIDATVNVNEDGTVTVHYANGDVINYDSVEEFNDIQG